MKNQVKVNNTQQYSDSQGEHIVHEGKLIFLTKSSPLWEEGALFREVETEPIFMGNYSNSGVQRNSTFESIKPIIISETEEIEVGDWIVFGKNNLLKKVEQVQSSEDLVVFRNNVGEKILRYLTSCKKVIALPEHFSDKHLQAIVDGKMRDGEVLVKCTSADCNRDSKGTCIENPNCMEWGMHNKKDKPLNTDCNQRPIIHLNQQNHITLFPAQQSLDEAAHNKANEEYKDATGFVKSYGTSGFIKGFKAGAKWAEK